MNKRKLLIWIPVAAVVVNGLAYLIVSNVRTPTKPPAVDDATAQDSRTTSAPRKGRDDDQDRTDRALARRSAGLAALDAGEYEKALIDFTEARALLGDKANVGELLRVTEDLRNRQRPLVRGHAPVASPPPPAPSRFMARSPAARHVAVREPPPRAEAQPIPSPPREGLIIVSTTPRGLLVHVDEAAVDLTPMRAKVKAGSHRIALFDGDRRVYETTVDVKEGGTATLLKDLPQESAAAESPAPREAPAPAAVAPVARREEPPPPVASAPPAPAPSPRRAVVARPAVAARAAVTGSLQITSPGLYGVVWVNGRPRGYPPLAVDELEEGPAKVEVRVNGIEKRAATVVVAPGFTKNVVLR